MAKKDNEKSIITRVDKSLWYFLRQHAVDKEISLNKLVIICLEKYKKSCEKRVDSK